MSLVGVDKTILTKGYKIRTRIFTIYVTNTQHTCIHIYSNTALSQEYFTSGVTWPRGIYRKQCSDQFRQQAHLYLCMPVLILKQVFKSNGISYNLLEPTHVCLNIFRFPTQRSSGWETYIFPQALVLVTLPLMMTIWDKNYLLCPTNETEQGMFDVLLNLC